LWVKNVDKEVDKEEDQLDPVPNAADKTTLSSEHFIHSFAREDLLRAAADPALPEDLALALLKRADLSSEVLEELARNRALPKLRNVKIAIASHAHTPRHVSVPLIRQFYTFDLMKVALSPVVPADLKRVADETMIAHLKTVTLGERLTLARQASGRIAAALLLDSEPRVINAALENGRLTEVAVAQSVLKPQAAALVQAVSRHAKWSYRRDVQIALLRTEFLSLARALAFARMLAAPNLREILQTSKLPSRIKEQILKQAANQ
jgi:hypothetical protein